MEPPGKSGRFTLLVDEELADRVWEAWSVGEIDDLAACLAR